MTQSRALHAGNVMRSRMILLLADGVAYQKIQDVLDTHSYWLNQVEIWFARFGARSLPAAS
jgi:hypothetical protein